jgi:cell division protease FtsH
MSDKLGPVSYKMSDEDPFMGREIQKPRSFSEHTMEVIDEEVLRILTEAQLAANKLLTERREELQAITDGLMKNEELDRYEIADLIGQSVHGDLVRPNNGVKAPSTNGSVESKSDDKSDTEDTESEKETASDQA